MTETTEVRGSLSLNINTQKQSVSPPTETLVPLYDFPPAYKLYHLALKVREFITDCRERVLESSLGGFQADTVQVDFQSNLILRIDGAGIISEVGALFLICTSLISQEHRFPELL
jgi:lantibiotic modifying enzyme